MKRYALSFLNQYYLIHAYYLDDNLKTSDNNILKLFTELGVQNHVPTPDESAEFRKMTKPVFEKYRKDGGVDLVDQVVKFVSC